MTSQRSVQIKQTHAHEGVQRTAIAPAARLGCDAWKVTRESASRVARSLRVEGPANSPARETYRRCRWCCTNEDTIESMSTEGLVGPLNASSR